MLAIEGFSLTLITQFDKKFDMVKKYSFILLFLCSIFVIPFISNASNFVFSDGFEDDFSNWTGNDPKWDTSGGNVHGGSKRGEVKGNTEPGDDVLLKNMSTSGLRNVSLDFWYRIKESLEDDDHLYVEWTGDGNNWNTIKDFTLVSSSTVWESATFAFPVEAGDKQDFAIRFRAHLGAVTSDIFYLDDIVVSAESTTNESIPTPDPTTSPQSAPTSEATLMKLFQLQRRLPHLLQCHPHLLLSLRSPSHQRLQRLLRLL